VLETAICQPADLTILENSGSYFANENSQGPMLPGSVEMLDPYLNRWTEMPGMSMPRADFTAALTTEVVLLFGGTGHAGPLGFEIYTF
jgi:hypothetical protein